MIDLKKFNFKFIDFVDITNNYHSLLNDEWDILFHGKNKFDSIILGSLIEEDYENLCLYCFHIPLNNIEFTDFMQKRISYRELILNRQVIYVVKKDYFNKTIGCYDIHVNEISQDYLPHQNSFLSEPINSNLSVFEFKFTGQDADNHELPLRTVSASHKVLEQFSNKTAKLLKLKNEDYQLYTKAVAASFDLQYYFKRKSTLEDELFSLEYSDPYVSLFNNILNYVINTFDELSADLKFSNEKYNSIKYEAISFYQSVSKIVLTEEDFKKKFDEYLKDCYQSVYELTNQYGKGFSDLAFSFQEKNGETKDTVKVINAESVEKIKQSETELEEFEIKNKELLIDDTFLQFQILIYQLNVETKKGWATLHDETDNSPKISFHIKNASSILDSIYTYSLDQSIKIRVNGIAKRKPDSTIKSIDIYHQ